MIVVLLKHLTFIMLSLLGSICQLAKQFDRVVSVAVVICVSASKPFRSTTRASTDSCVHQVFDGMQERLWDFHSKFMCFRSYSESSISLTSVIVMLIFLRFTSKSFYHHFNFNHFIYRTHKKTNIKVLLKNTKTYKEGKTK